MAKCNVQKLQILIRVEKMKRKCHIVKILAWNNGGEIMTMHANQES